MSSAWTILCSCCSCFWEVGKTSFQHTLTHCISWIQVVFWEHTASFRTINHNYKRTRLIRFHASWCKETRKISVAFYLILWNTALIVVPLAEVFRTNSYKQTISVLPYWVSILQLLPSYWSYGTLWERKGGEGGISIANALKLLCFVPPAT